MVTVAIRLKVGLIRYMTKMDPVRPMNGTRRGTRQQRAKTGESQRLFEQHDGVEHRVGDQKEHGHQRRDLVQPAAGQAKHECGDADDAGDVGGVARFARRGFLCEETTEGDHIVFGHRLQHTRPLSKS